MLTLPSAPANLPGVILAFRFDKDGQGTSLLDTGMFEIDTSAGGFVWVHFNLTDARARAWIEQSALLPQDAKSALLAPNEHPHLDHDGDVFWGAFSDFQRDFEGMTSAFGHLRFAIAPNFLISGRRHALQCVDSIRDAVTGGRRMQLPEELLEALLSSATDAIAVFVAELLIRVDAIEDKVLDDAFHDERAALGNLRRHGVAVHRQLSGMLSIFRRLLHAPSRTAAAEIKDLAERVIQRLDALDGECHSVIERARLLQDELAAKVATETNRHIYVLTTLTTLLLPPTLIAGLFGMNVEGIPFAHGIYGFMIVIAVCVVSALLVLWMLRRAKLLY